MPAKPRLRLPIFWKILLSCLLLSGFLIGGSYWYTTYKLQQEGRGPYLVKHFKRFQNYKHAIGLAVGAVADVLANDETLRSALANPAAEGAPDPIGPRVARIAELLGRRTSIRPDLLLVFDRNGRPLYTSPGAQVNADELRELEAIAKIKSGGAYTNELVVLGERVYQATGVPITRAGSGEPLGGVLLGVALERYFQEYKEQSDESEPKQHRLSLITAEGEVLASVLPKDQWKELGEAVRPEKRVKAKDGPDTIEVLKFGKGEWDFTTESVSGFQGTAHRAIGNLYLVRTRAGLKKTESVGVSIIVGSVAAILIASMLAFVITRPIRRLIRATHEIADGEGDLTQRIEVTTNDETGDLANNVNKLFDNLHKLARDVQGASFQVGASSAEISAASKQMLEGVKDQAIKVESSTAAVTELSSSIHHVASNAMEATKAAAQSNTAVQAAMESMASIRSAVEQAAERIGELGESSKRIGNIVEVIRQISEQTSLLALNASIEAAHAGEQGRGFAVVADEVSSLARRVGQSAKDIEDLIATIKDQTADAVRTMEVGTEAVESGTRLVTHTLASLKQITEVIQDTASAVQEQALVSDEIARNMDSVREIANEVLGSSEEAVIQGDQLHNLAVQLEESVRSFRLDDGASIAPPRVVGRATEPARRLAAARRPATRAASKPSEPRTTPGKDG